MAHKRRKNTLKQTKGFRWGRKSKFRLAKDALYHAWEYAYRDRKVKKRDFRKSQESQINTVCRRSDLTYSRFIAGLKKKKIGLDRKVLAELARDNQDIFKKVVEEAKS